MANEVAPLAAETSDLGPKASDRIASGLKALVGMIPGIGSVLTEIVSEIVPNQRIERVEKYLQLLSNEFEKHKLDESDPRLKLPENIDLIEEGAYQAARGISDERKEYLAKAVAQGIASDEKDKIDEKRILKIIGELDDVDVLILTAYNDRFDESNLWEKLLPPPAFIGSSIRTVRKEQLFQAAKVRLETLQLLTRKISLNNKTKLPEYDTWTGQPKGRVDINSLGRLVLERIGLAKPEPDDIEHD